MTPVKLFKPEADSLLLTWLFVARCCSVFHVSASLAYLVSRISLASEAAAVLFLLLLLFSSSQVTLITAVHAEPTPGFYAMSCSSCIVPCAY